MDSKTANLFFENCSWFNSFFDDLNQLFNKIGDVVLESHNYSSKWLYYYKSNDAPQIPKAYFLGIDGPDLPKVQVIAVLSNEGFDNPEVSLIEPRIVVLQHNYSKSNSQYIGYQFLENKVTKIHRVNDIIYATMKWDEEFLIRALDYPLDTFSELDEVMIREKISSRLLEDLPSQP